MKALSVTQPWASVICSGIKDVENRLWQAAEAPGRILIHATKAKVPGNWEDVADDYVSAIKNARLMGQIPEYKDMPYGSIIGYVECYRIVKDSDSFWAQPDCFHWCLRDAYLFDEPIPDIKGVRGHLFDVDVDENALPAAHRIEFLQPQFDGDTLLMPACPDVIALAEAGEKEFWYDFDLLFDNAFFDEQTNGVRQPKHVRFYCGDKTVDREVVGIEVGPYANEEGNPIRYIGLDGNERDWQYLAIVVK